jgi:pimeloyl-ACP methyl ester carboxylesterase
MGAEEQIASDPVAALAAYRAAGAQTKLIQGAGHSPNVEKPIGVAALVEAFARHEMQKPLQNRKPVRRQP